ncbi:MAG: DUF1853 family protein [Oceanospirillales bacterium]|nr:DUF1853 family protein [Oceanospirillales bacterium]
MNRRPPYLPSTHPQRLQAELEWLIDTPDLLLPPAKLQRPTEIDWCNRQCIEKIDYQPRWRLGEHFENIVYHHLKRNVYVSDIKRNIQIKDGRRTLGEFDFLVQMNQRWLHLEVALKLYLLDGSDESLDHYIGTRRDDCLAAKWQRMLGHQIELARQPEALLTLAELGVTQPMDSALWVKGWLFYHPLRPLTAHQACAINPSHLRGWWITHSELVLIQKPNTFYMLVRKPDWLLPAWMLATPALSFSELQAQLYEERGANLVVAVVKRGNNWEECSRGFVVADSWPQEDN